MKLGHIDLEPCSYMIVYERINKNGATDKAVLDINERKLHII